MSGTPGVEHLEVKMVEDQRTLESLRSAWRLLDSHPDVRPFQQFGWVASWMRTIGTYGGWRPNVATLWRGDRLVAVLPLCVRRYKGLRILEWMAARVSDYCDALVEPGIARQEALRLLWQAIHRRGGFDFARLSHIRQDAHVLDLLQSLDPWTETLEDAGGVGIVWASGEDWLSQQSAGMRDRVRYKLRRMERAGFRVKVFACDEPCAHLIDTLAEQKRPWLAARGLTSMIMDSTGVEFLKRVTEESARRGELHLSIVHNENVIAACDLAFVRNGVIYSYIASFDPKYAKYSFGRLLTDRLLMWACDSGQKRFDLLLGAYDYKSEYNCTLEPVRTLVLPHNLLGRAAVAVYRRLDARAKSAVKPQGA